MLNAPQRATGCEKVTVQPKRSTRHRNRVTTIGAVTITYSILGVPYHKIVSWGPKPYTQSLGHQLEATSEDLFRLV